MPPRLWSNSSQLNDRGQSLKIEPWPAEPHGCMSVARPAERTTHANAKPSGESLLRHDRVEVVKTDLAIPVGVRTLDHLAKFFGCHRLAELFGYPSEVLERDGLGLVVVEQSKDLSYPAPRLLVTQLR